MPPHAWVNRIWYGRAMPPWWLRPAGCAFGRVVALRRWLYRRGWLRRSQLPCAVVVVGNITVGGTGKTPLVAWLVRQLASRGYRPGIVTRGYRGRLDGVRLVTAGDDPAQVGDEAVLLARLTGVPVAAGRDRPAGARLLVAARCDVVVSDDGLQHYALGRDCEIAVVDGERRLGNGAQLPAGPLREPPSRLAEVDAVVVNGGPADAAGGVRMRLHGGQAVRLRDGERRPLASFAGSRAHAVAGIGNPERFFDLLRASGIVVIGHPLADHARLARADVDFGDGLPVLMTEKDAVKCRGHDTGQQWAVPVEAAFDPVDAAKLLGVVIRSIDGRRGRTDEG